MVPHPRPQIANQWSESTKLSTLLDYFLLTHARLQLLPKFIALKPDLLEWYSLKTWNLCENNGILAEANQIATVDLL